MQFNLYTTVFARTALFAAALAAAATAFAASPEETAFLAENNTAMMKMMNGMKIESSGDVDTDFVSMMVPHHEGAIEMAQAELRYGRNEQLRRIAREIIAAQQQEIPAMRQALGQPTRSSATSSDQPAAARPAGARPMSDRSMRRSQ